MRHTDRWQEIAELAVAYRDRGVVGFDIAGPEDGFPPSRHVEIWRYLAEQDFPTTIHAGEAAGPASIAEAVHLGQADRIGHGVRIVEDIAFAEVDGERRAELGRRAARGGGPPPRPPRSRWTRALRRPSGSPADAACSR
jgi:adenosine deaminase